MPAGDLWHIPSDKPPSMMSNHSFHSSTPIVSFTVGPAMWPPRGRSCLPDLQTGSRRCSLRIRERWRSDSHSSIRAFRPSRWRGFLFSTIFSCRSRPENRRGLFTVVGCRHLCSFTRCGASLALNRAHERRRPGALPLSGMEPRSTILCLSPGPVGLDHAPACPGRAEPS
jgi:hypothetical protein